MKSEQITYNNVSNSVGECLGQRRKLSRRSSDISLQVFVVTTCFLLFTAQTCLAFSFTRSTSIRHELISKDITNNLSKYGRSRSHRISQIDMLLSPIHRSTKQKSSATTVMVMTSPDDIQNTSNISSKLSRSAKTSSAYMSKNENDESPSPQKIKPTLNALPTSQRRKRKKYKRKRPKRGSEEESNKLQKKRQAKYEVIRNKDEVDIWDFESLFPEPVWDDETIQKDLHEVSDRDAKTEQRHKKNGSTSSKKKEKIGSTSLKSDKTSTANLSKLQSEPKLQKAKSASAFFGDNSTEAISNSTKIDRPLTRMVEDRMYGFRRDQMGEFEYDNSLMGDGAVQFRDGKRLGHALTVNVDRLNYFAKKELAKNKLEEAEELYETAVEMAPHDGRAYLGLSRIAQKRRDFKYAKDCLRTGIARSYGDGKNTKKAFKITDKGANPFLLQALGTLEERMGHLAEAEKLYIAAANSRPSHAAAWVALAQLRTRKLRQGPKAGRVCYREAERELEKAGLPPSSHVYTAWASLEWKAGNIPEARKLFRMALDIDPKCSAAWNQLGVMESQQENWDRSEECFKTVLKYDRRNSRVLQAYAIMETKRPDSDSRRAIGLFEKALKANPRDGGVLQAYALYVAKLGDIDSARDLLKRGTVIDKRHAALWQAWGVLETRHGTPSAARDVFQQGIWACAQSSGGQSGGRRCARLWQAWGVLESYEKDYSAARRCFSRALDADNRNVAAVTAWTLMEEELGNFKDARLIFERALRQFGPQSEEKMALWRAYELMESLAGNQQAAQEVSWRSIRDRDVDDDSYYSSRKGNTQVETKAETPQEDILKESPSNEVEVMEWNSSRSPGFGSRTEVWMNEGSIESKVPAATMKKKSNKPMTNKEDGLS